MCSTCMLVLHGVGNWGGGDGQRETKDMCHEKRLRRQIASRLKCGECYTKRLGSFIKAIGIT